jgi:zinc transport system substrate-binding protein
MKTFIHVITLTLLALTAQSAELTVQCGIPPLVSVVSAVGGDRVQVGSLMNSNQDPHTWSPSPKAVIEVRDADLFFTVGMPFEQTVAEKLAVMNPALRVVNVADTLNDSSDVHVWMSVSKLSMMSSVIETALSAADPEGALVYKKNRESYEQQLAETHERLKEKLAAVHGKTFYVYHPVFFYFARDYGLNQGVVELDGKSPSPKDLLALINRAREEHVRVLFVQPQFSQRPAKILADRIDGKVLSINPMAENPIDVIEQAADSLAEIYAIP